MAFCRAGSNQPFLSWIGRLALGLLIALALRAAVRAESPPPAGNLYAEAAARAQVPLEVLVAIAGAESGFHPWALNIDGHQVYCRSRAEAEQRLLADDHVAIGLMQINWRYWGPRLGLTKSELLDPATNLRYGARILKDGLSRSGSLWFRISSYHSGTIEQREKYNELVYRNYRRYLAGEFPAAPPAARLSASHEVQRTATPMVLNRSSARPFAASRAVTQPRPIRQWTGIFPSPAEKRKSERSVFTFDRRAKAPTCGTP